MKPSRRNVLALGGAALLAGAPVLAATPEDLHETDREGDGPFYKPGAPMRSNFIEPGMKGEHFRLKGRVFDVTGKVLGGALLDLWHANDRGEYDNQGFRLRGRFHADDRGRFDLTSFRPRWYKAGDGVRAAHYHVKVSAPEHPLLTTALYFKGDPMLGKDSMVQPSLIVTPRQVNSLWTGDFDFVLRTA